MFLQAFYKKCGEVGLQAGMTHAMGNCMRVCIPPHLRGGIQKPAENFREGRGRQMHATENREHPIDYVLSS